MRCLIVCSWKLCVNFCNFVMKGLFVGLVFSMWLSC